MTSDRRNPLLFERDGDFNPGWALFLAFSLVGLLGSLASVVVAVVTEDGTPLVASFSFIGFAMLVTAIIVVPIARAKLLATLKGSAQQGGGGGYFSQTTSYASDAGAWADEGAPSDLAAEDLIPPVAHGRPEPEPEP